jgi:AcrR family transcriptional regulator
MTTTRVDRAALGRRAMVEVVAEQGLNGASMSLVAKRAGVATGTPYVHYASKDDLLIASFVEAKRGLGEAGTGGIAEGAQPRDVFETVWRGAYEYLSADPALAMFLLQVEASPLRAAAHDALPEDDPLTEAAGRLSDSFVDLPGELLYDLSLAPAVRLAASGERLSGRQTKTLIESCWRAVAVPGP